MCELLPIVHGFLHDCEPGGLWISTGRIAHLEFLVGVEKQYIDSLHVLHVSVPFELLSDLCAEGGDWKVEGVHGLDLGCLVSCQSLLSNRSDDVSGSLLGTALFSFVKYVLLGSIPCRT